MTTAFDVFQTFHAIKLHFSLDKYDFFKYKGKLKNITEESFESNKHKFYFELIASNYEHDYRDYILSLIFHYGPKIWTGDLISVQNKTIYRDWKERTDIDNLVTVLDMELDHRGKLGVHSPLFSTLLRKDISLEQFMLVILQRKLLETYDRIYEDDPVWVEHSFLIHKYMPFIEGKLVESHNVWSNYGY